MLRRRVKELEADPARKAQFERDLARLPEGRDGFLDAMGEGLSDTVRYGALRAFLRSV